MLFRGSFGGGPHSYSLSFMTNLFTRKLPCCVIYDWPEIKRVRAQGELWNNSFGWSVKFGLVFVNILVTGLTILEINKNKNKYVIFSKKK